MSYSNPMHRESNLHPIMQQALAPFAPKFPPLSPQQRAALENCDANIEMLEQSCMDHADRIAHIREARAALLRYFAGEIGYLEVPYWGREALAAPIPPEYLGS